MGEDDQDVLNYVKQVLTATETYLENPDENANRLNILEKCEILVDCVPNSKELVVFTDCLTKLLNILNGNFRQVTDNAARKILQFFVNLVQSPVGIWSDILAEKYQLHNDVVKFLCRNKSSINLDVGFILLRKLSNCIKKVHSQHYIAKLVPLLVRHINADDPMLQCALEVLANVKRSNPYYVQDVLQSHVKLADFHDSILNLIVKSDDSSSVQVSQAAISFLLQEIDVEEWPRGNFQNRLEFIFDSIMIRDVNDKCNCLDMFLWLLEYNSFVVILQNYPLFNTSFDDILKTFFTCDSQPVFMAKLFGLLTAILRIPSLRPLMVAVMTTPIDVALKWMANRVEVSWKASIQAVDFLKELLEGGSSDTVSLSQDHFREIVRIIDDEFQLPIDDDDFILDVKLSKKVAILHLLNSLCADRDFADFVRDHLDMDPVIGKLRALLIAFRFKSYESHNFDACFSNCWNLRVSTIIEIMQFLLQMNENGKNLQECIMELLADSHMMEVFTLALSSKSEKDVNSVILLLRKTGNISSFPSNILAKHITTRNNEKSSHSTVVSDMRSKTAIETLEITELKPSQVIDVYEKKIAAYEAKLKTNERLLNSMIESVSQIKQELSQSNRDWVNCQAETLRFRELLIESERRSEVCQESLASNISNQQELQNQLKSLNEDLENMTDFSSKQRSAIETYKKKIEDGYKENAASKNELRQIGDMNKLLGQHLSEAKDQINKLLAEKANAETDMKKTFKLLRNENDEYCEKLKILTAKNNSLTEKYAAAVNELDQYKQMALLIQNATKKLPS